MKLFVFSFLLIAFSAICAWCYLIKPRTGDASHDSARVDDRPWRRVGAAICLVVSVMFVLGVYLVDVPAHPRAYAAYWAILMGLTLWLCVLAVKDMLYTRRMIDRWRAGRRRTGPTSSASGVKARNSQS